MKNKTVIVVLTLAALLFLYILLVENRLQTTDEQKARAENVFQTLRADRITKIELHTPKGHVVLEASVPAPGEEKSWRITSPTQMRADDTEAVALVSSLDFLIYDRKVEENSKDKRFGLSNPRIKGMVHFGDEKLSFSVGNDAPGGDGVYMSVESNPDFFFVVDKEFFEAANKGLNDLRDKHVLSRELDEVTEVTVKSPSASFTADMRAERWQLEMNDTRVPASLSQIKQLLEQVRNLKVDQFVSDHTAELKKYGLDTPQATLRIKTEKTAPIELRFGTSCSPQSVYATITGSQAVQCISSHFMEVLRFPAERYVEKRLLPFGEKDITRLEFRKEQEKLVIEKNDDELWRVSGLAEEDTSVTAVSTLLDELNKVSASSIFFNNTPEPIPLSSLPTATLFAETTDQQSTSVRLFTSPSRPDDIFMQKDDSTAIFEFSRDVLAKIDPYPIRFRKKVWENAQEQDIVSVNIVSQNGTQTLHKMDETWMISKPEAVKADTAAIKKLLTLISETPVSSYVRTGDNPFAKPTPFAKITAHIAQHRQTETHQDDTQTRSVVIEIGDRYDNASRYARIQGHSDSLFTIDDEHTAFLNAPLAARDLLAVNASIITHVELRGTERSFSASKSDGAWKSDQCALNSDALERIVIDFGATKAVAAKHFGTDIGPNITTVSFSSSPDEPAAVLHFGTAQPGTDDVLAYREGVNITFAMPLRLIRDLQAVCR